MSSVEDLVKAAKRGDVGEVDSVLSREGAADFVNGFSESGSTALYAASTGGHVAVIERLVRSGADVNGRDKFGWYPIHGAVSAGQSSAVDLLIRLGADTRKIDTASQSALHLACQRNFPGIAEALIRAGADVNAADRFGWTPLMDSVRLNRLECASLLAPVPGVAIDALNSHGQTALYLAVNNRQAGMVKVLLAAGANPNVGLNTSIPLWRAFNFGDRIISEMLVHAGATITDELAKVLESNPAMRQSIVPMFFPPLVSFCSGATIERLGSSSPVSLLQGFPHLVRFISGHGLPSWIFVSKDLPPLW